MGQGASVVLRRLLLLTTATLFGACAQPPAATPEPAAAPPQVVTETVAPEPADRKELARRALALYDAKDYEAAVPALTAVARDYPEVAPFLRLRIMEAEVARQNLQSAANIATELVALSDTTAATVARLRLPAIYAQLGNAAATDAAWQQAMQVAIDELTESDIVDMATALAKAGRTDLATRTRMRLLSDYTQGRYTEQTYDFLKAGLDALPLAEKIALAGKLSRANRYDQALDLFAKIPNSAAEARSTRLRALFNSRNYTQLLDETKDVNLGDSSLVLLRARGAWRAGRPEEFLSGLAQVEKEFPGSKEAVEAKVIRAKYYVTDVTDYAKSIENLSAAVRAGAAGNDGENIWNLGWTYTLWGRYDDALKTYDQYIRSYPDGDWKTNSLFWSAKIHDKHGRTAERDRAAAQIVAEYPFSYYAYRAKELWPGVAAPMAAPTRFPDIEAELAKVEDARFTTIYELQDIGLNRAAAREMKVLASQHSANPGVQFMLADVYVRGGEPFKANTVLQRQFRQFIRHGGTNIPHRFWQILYPLAYWETLQKEAQRRGLDPYLLASITRQ
ncbi:MAG TPA: tetratricopeptide repeat protein, partial [Thermoanaerobaculia bacterium]|nr:tetratricopeptide repeat protein [Thermoanaerobaculia bacterium]